MQKENLGDEEGKMLAFLDIGTNSIRMVLLEVRKNHTFTVIREEKEVVRLGEGLFVRGLLQKKAMDRAINVCRHFLEMAYAFRVGEVVAVATCATREAKNQQDFLSRLVDEAGLHVQVVSGREEARLIYLGVSSGFHLEDKKTLFIDIGGGSTEISLGDQYEYENLESLGLGAIRLTSMFLKDGGRGAVGDKLYEKMKKYSKNKMYRAVERLDATKVKFVVGTSGTIINLAEIARKKFHPSMSKKELNLKYKELKLLCAQLRQMTLAERRKIAGMNPGRADIIVAGAIILETLMEELDIKELEISRRGLQHGMFVDYLMRHGLYLQPEQISVRQKSVLLLGRSCNIDEQHAKRVQTLAVELFDSSKKLHLHSLSKSERELLLYASFLHDIGNFISFNSHHKHSHYLISNADLLGFNLEESKIIAATARYHRKRLPHKRDEEFSSLGKKSKKVVLILSMLLRLAEKLERSHTNCVKKACFSSVDDKYAVLMIESDEECDLERWGVENSKKVFRKVFDKKLRLQINNKMN